MQKEKKPSKAEHRKLIKRWMRKADKALSNYVRQEAIKLYDGICPLCRKNPVKCCFHFITRRKKNVRWLPENLLGTCFSCNYEENYFPDASRAWFIKNRGLELYFTLVELAQKPFEPSIEYLKQIVRRYNGETHPIS